jgi:predicted nucleic acid-binding protein
MNGKFADSNILLYLPGADAARSKVAEEILRDNLTISVQVLNEIASVMLGKWRTSLAEVESVLALVRQATDVRGLDLATHTAGMAIAKRYRIGVYDSMIVAAALLAKCNTLYSEDFHHGLVIENQLRILNPFRPPFSPA